MGRKITNYRGFINESVDYHDENFVTLKNAMQTDEDVKSYLFGHDGLMADIWSEAGGEHTATRNIENYVAAELNTSFTTQSQTDRFKEILVFHPDDDQDMMNLKSRLYYFFMRRLVANIPHDVRLGEDSASLLKFIKTYVMKYVHGYLRPYGESKPV